MLTTNEIGQEVRHNISGLTGILEKIQTSKKYGDVAVVSFIDENGQPDILFGEDHSVWSAINQPQNLVVKPNAKLWYELKGKKGFYGILVEKWSATVYGEKIDFLTLQTPLGEIVEKASDWSNVAESQPKMLCQFSDSMIEAEMFPETGDIIDDTFYFMINSSDTDFDGESAWNEYQAINNPDDDSDSDSDGVDEEEWKFSSRWINRRRGE